MQVRPYTEDDLEAVQRVWREVGWVDDDEEAALVAPFLAEGSAHVALLDGVPEACGSVHPGTIDHTGTRLPLSVVTSITVSRVGRRQGLARAVLHAAVLDGARSGAAVSALGMFEQGFYDRSGFGTGAEMVFHRLDPASLPAELPYRRPVRLTAEDAEELTAALAARAVGHGGVVLPSVQLRRAELGWTEGGFGLGHRDADGTLTHFVWCSAKGEHGPYRVTQWAWRTVEQLRELLADLRSLADQVRWLVLPEPWCLQLQVLTDRPNRQYLLTKGTEQHYKVDADAWWQLRVLDLPSCTAVLRTTRPVAFDLTVADPLTAEGWDGAGGDWHVELGPDGSSATRGHAGGLPVLRTSVNSVSRAWFGVRSPAVVAATDGWDAPAALVDELDAALHLPRPDVGHDF